MAKRKVSERDFLIEQCLYDAYCEREGVINEGFVDDFKANARAAGEWLKQDAKDSFRLRKKGDVQANRKNAAASGKIKSYAGSLAKTMSDFKKSGGTLGRNMSNIDDVINRLDLVSKGKLPRGVAGSNWAEQGQQNAYSTEAPSNTNVVSPSTRNTQSVSSQPSKNSAAPNNNGYFTTGATAPSASNANSTPKNTSSNNSPTPNRNLNQSTTDQQVEPPQQPQEKIDVNEQQPAPTNSPETQNKPLSKRDIARKKRQEKIFKRKEKEAEKAKIERAKRIKKAGKAAAKANKAQEKNSADPAAPTEPAAPSASAAPAEQQEQSKNENPAQPTPAFNPEASKSDNQTGNEDNLSTDDQTSSNGSSDAAATPNTPGQLAMLDSIPDNQGTYVGDINNINQQTPWTTTIGGTESGDAYIGGATNLPNEDNWLPGDAQPQLPAPKEQLGLPAPEETPANEPLALPAPAEDPEETPAEIIPAVKEDPLRGVVPNHTYSRKRRKHNHERDENGNKIKVKPEKEARKARQAAASAKKSRQKMTQQHGTQYEYEEVIKEHYNTRGQISMLNSIL